MTDTPTIAEIRDAAKVHADARGVRAVAREIGISRTGLSHFADGATPYLWTAPLLRAWYSAHAQVETRPAMPPRHPLAGISDAALRAALTRAVATSSLRAVAEQVGLTHRGLGMFIRAEARPRDVTLRKLREWYLRDAATLPKTDASTVNAAVALLLESAPRARQCESWASMPINDSASFAEVDAEHAGLLPGLPDEARRRVLKEWAVEDLLPAYSVAGIAPPRWVLEATQDGT